MTSGRSLSTGRGLDRAQNADLSLLEMKFVHRALNKQDRAQRDFVGTR